MSQQVKPEKILIVEDEEVLRDMIVDMLGFEGYTVQVAKNGLEALAFLRGEESYLIFLDLLLPDINGDAICDWLGTNHNHVIILMSALYNLTHLIDINSLHVNGTLPKPFKVEDLISIIQKYMT